LYINGSCWELGRNEPIDTAEKWSCSRVDFCSKQKSQSLTGQLTQTKKGGYICDIIQQLQSLTFRSSMRHELPHTRLLWENTRALLLRNILLFCLSCHYHVSQCFFLSSTYWIKSFLSLSYFFFIFMKGS